MRGRQFLSIPKRGDKVLKSMGHFFFSILLISFCSFLLVFFHVAMMSHLHAGSKKISSIFSSYSLTSIFFSNMSNFQIIFSNILGHQQLQCEVHGGHDWGLRALPEVRGPEASVLQGSTLLHAKVPQHIRRPRVGCWENIFEIFSKSSKMNFQKQLGGVLWEPSPS